MKDETKNIICQSCGASIDIDAALTNQIENKLKKEYEDKKKSLKESIEQESLKKFEQDKAELEKNLRDKILKDAELEKIASDEKNKLLEQQLVDKEAKKLLMQNNLK